MMRPRWAAGPGRAGRLAPTVPNEGGTVNTRFFECVKYPQKPQKLLFYSRCAYWTAKNGGVSSRSEHIASTPETQFLLLLNFATPHTGTHEHAPSAAKRTRAASGRVGVAPGVSDMPPVYSHTYSPRHTQAVTA